MYNFGPLFTINWMLDLANDSTYATVFVKTSRHSGRNDQICKKRLVFIDSYPLLLIVKVATVKMEQKKSPTCEIWSGGKVVGCRLIP